MSYEKGKLYQLALSSVQPDPEQPRKYFDEQALVAPHQAGFIQPLGVRYHLFRCAHILLVLFALPFQFSVYK